MKKSILAAIFFFALSFLLIGCGEDKQQSAGCGVTVQCTINQNQNNSNGQVSPTPPASQATQQVPGNTPTSIVTQPAGSEIIVPDGKTQAVHTGDCVDVPDNSHISAPVKWTHVFTPTWTRVLVSGDGTVTGTATVYVNAKICSQEG